MAQKKKTKKRTSSSGKRSTSVKYGSGNKGKQPQKTPMNPQVKAILLFASAIVLLVLAIIPGEALWSKLRCFFYGVFGFGFILIPFLLGYLAVMTAKEKEVSRLSTKVILPAITILFVSSLFFMYGSGDYKAVGFFEAMKLSYIDSSNVSQGLGGGILSCIVGYPLVALCGDNGIPKFLAILVIIVCVMLLTNITLVDLANVAKRRINALRQRREPIVDDDYYNDSEDNRGYIEEVPKAEKQKRKKRGSRIDIPLTDDNTDQTKPDDVLVDDEAAAVESPAERLVNAVLLAQDDEYSDDASKASLVAQQITKAKGVEHMADGAMQPDPETVSVDPMAPASTDDETPIDLQAETRAVASEIKSEEEKKEENTKYSYPPVQLLKLSLDGNDAQARRELEENAERLIETLESFNVKATICDICRGPSVTRYEIKPAPGVKITKITNLADDIALSLAADGVRIEAPIPGKAAVGIEVPNKCVSMVTMRELIDSSQFRNAKSKLTCVLGKDISGEIVTTDLAKMPHLLIAGTTGSGKSVCVNSLLMSILFKATPDEVKLLLVDPKMVEFSKYKGLPHLLIPVVSDAKKAAGALNWAVTEMMQRYKLFSEYDCKDIISFNNLVESNLQYIEDNKDDDPDACMEVNGLPVPKEKLPRFVIAIDELADLMMVAAKEVEDAICRLAQMARAAGMHLVLATQRPTVNVITGLIKGNIPSKIALKVSTNTDSRIILDCGGAESLIGRGDMLYSPVGSSKPIRVQGCYASDEEIEGVTEYIKKSHRAQYNEEIEEKIRRIAAEEMDKNSKGNEGGDDIEIDDKMEEAIKFVIEAGQASTSMLQRRLRVGYARAGRMIDDMEKMGIVGPYQGAKPREVLLTYQDWLERNNIVNNET